MATWARGIDFKNAGNTARVGSVGVYGTDTSAEKIYIGLGTEPWNNAGLQITSSAINFKGNKIYHSGDKPTASEIGAATSSHTHNYAGSSSAGGSANSAVKLATARTINGVSFDGTANITVTAAANGGTSAACSGNAATATKLQTARTIFGKSFDGSGNVAGKAFVYGTYTSTASSRYTNGALEIRENGLVGSAQSDIGYAPQLGFHWSGKIAATLAMSSGGEFQFINQAGTGYSNVRAATFYGALSGNASTASSAATLTTARTINGTSFNGSANITTANWGTARTLTIGNTGKSVNGSANVSWSLSEIGAAASSHTHTTVGAYIGVSNTTGTNGYGLSLYGGAVAGAPSYGIMFQQTATFGTHGSVTSDWATYFTMAGSTSRGWIFKAGNSSGGNVASISATGVITASSFVGSLSGNASSASSAATLTTARTINGTSFNGSASITTANWGTARTITIGSTGKSVNGSGNVSWSLSEIGAAASSHTHSYLPLSGGTLTGRLTSNGKISIPTTGSSWLTGKTLTNASIAITTAQTTGSYHPVLAVQSSSGHVANLGGLGDNFGFYGYKSTRTENGTDWSFVFNVGTGAVSSTGTITAPSFSGALSGNATTATTLQTARTINGTSFNGSANITTANWGTARTITIGSTGKSVNGSGNVSWSLSEIGAAASSHTHSYVPLSGGTMTGTLTLNSGANFGSVTLTKASNSDTLQVSGTSTTSMGAIKLGSGGCRIYGLGTATKLYVEGGIYTNGDIEAGNGYIKSITNLWGKTSDIVIEPKRGTGFEGGARFGWTGATAVGSPRFQLVPTHTTDFRVGSPESPVHGVHGKNSYVTTSDRNEKENIQYIDKGIALMSSLTRSVENITKDDFYNFFKDEIKFASYDFKTSNIENLETNLGFIAQDIAGTKVGSKIVIPPRETIRYYNEDGTIEHEEEVLNGTYAYSTGNFAAAIAIALQKAIEEIELLKEEIELLKK